MTLLNVDKATLSLEKKMSSRIFIARGHKSVTFKRLKGPPKFLLRDKTVTLSRDQCLFIIVEKS